MPNPTLAQLKQAVALAERIEQLQTELASLVGRGSSVSTSPDAAVSAPTGKRRGRRKMSAEARARIAAAQRARWAKAKGTSALAVASPAPRKKKRKLSPEGRARIVAALKARWAAKK